MAARGPGVLIPPTLLFVAGFAAALWWNGEFPWPLETAGSDLLRIVTGAFIAGAGAALFGMGLWTFARLRTGILLQQAATRVVTSGPYRWSRNPQYIAFVGVYVGATVLANSVWPLLVLPAVVFAVHRL